MELTLVTWSHEELHSATRLLLAKHVPLIEIYYQYTDRNVYGIIRVQHATKRCRVASYFNGHQ